MELDKAFFFKSCNNLQLCVQCHLPVTEFASSYLFTLQNSVFSFLSFFIGSSLLFKAFGENPLEELWDVLWKRLQWMVF